MTIVVDASVAIKGFVREPLNDEARHLLAIPDPLIAPDWIAMEAASAFSRKVRTSELLVIHAERHLSDLPTFFERLYPSLTLVDRAMMLSFRLRHLIYDCLYLALAEQEDTCVVTADEKFVAKAQAAGFSARVRPLA